MLDASLIRIDGGTQPRAQIDITVVEDYASQISAGASFPPLVVFYDGAHHWLADGFHRYHARHDVLGEAELECDVHMGTRREAVLYAVGANAAHGLRRTNEDKRRSVLTLLNDEEWAKWSDSEIARRCAVSHNMVSDMRKSSPSSNEGERTYTTKHGTQATMQTANLGRSQPQEPPPSYQPPRSPAPPAAARYCYACGQEIP